MKSWNFYPGGWGFFKIWGLLSREFGIFYPRDRWFFKMWGFFPGIWDFFIIWGFLSRGLGFFKIWEFSPSEIKNFRKSGNLYPGDFGGLFYPQNFREWRFFSWDARLRKFNKVYKRAKSEKWLCIIKLKLKKYQMLWKLKHFSKHLSQSGHNTSLQ